MINSLNYTTEKLKAEILLDKEVSEEAKAIEEAKPVISDDMYAQCDFLNKLNNSLEVLRLTMLRSR